MVSRVDLLVLGLLTDRPMHGYEISQVISGEDIEAWLSVSLTSIYYSLNKLKKNGLIVETVHRSDNSPERSVFHLTDKGRSCFLELLERSLASTERTYFDMDLAVYFINRLPSQRAAHLLERRKRFVAGLRQEMSDRVAELRDRNGHSTTSAILDHSLRFLDMEAGWLQELSGAISGDGERAAVGSSPARVMTLLGNLQAMHLPDVLKFVSAGKLSGALTVGDPPDENVLFFENGSPVRLAVRSDGLPIADPEDAHRRFSAVFRWEAGHIAFEQGLSADGRGVPTSASVDELIVAGARKVDAWGTIQRFVPSVDTVFEPRTERFVDRLPLNDLERQVALALDGSTDVRTLASALGLSEFETSRALYSLFALGALSTVAPDMVRVRMLLRRLSATLLHSAEVLGGQRLVQECEQAVNGRVGASSLVRFVEGRTKDHSEGQTDPATAAQAYLSFLKVVADVLGDRLGRGLVEQTLQRVLRESTPDLQDAAERYGFTRLIDASLGG